MSIYLTSFSVGDYEKVKELDKSFTTLAGFQTSYPVTGQTYSRLVDAQIVSALSLLGSGVHKVCSCLFQDNFTSSKQVFN